jgi:Asp-tRNA(Asn)/Glu-tRNA(Gln) amidotransferase C subunit
MTSWIRVPPTKRREEPETRQFFYQTTEEPFARQSLSLLYSFLFAQENEGELCVSDTSSSLGANFPFLRSAFQDVSGLSYVDMRPSRSTSLNGKIPNVAGFLNRIQSADIRTRARTFFSLTDTAARRVDAFLKTQMVAQQKQGAPRRQDMPLTGFDVAVAIPSQQSFPMPLSRQGVVSQYTQAIRSVQTSLKASKMDIFVYSEDLGVVDDLVRQGDATWTFYSFPPSASQQTPTFLNARLRQDSYYQTLSEIALLQNVKNLITSVTAPLGQLLYLTGDAPDSGLFRSVDGAKFRPF